MIQDDLNDSEPFEDDPKDKDFVPGEEFVGKADKFQDAVRIGMRFNISAGVISLIINLVLIAVGMQTECISWNAIEKLKKRMGNEARNEHDEVNVNLICMKMDGKTSKVNIGKNKTVKMETVTVIKEPNPGYLDHFHFAKKGLALAGAMMNVIMKTKSRLSLLAIGCGKLLLRLDYSRVSERMSCEMPAFFQILHTNILIKIYG